MLYFIEYLRALAAILITNSHFKGVYPTDILSFGGGLGLALFFMISGYLLANVNSETKFFKWYGKKAIRMYIPLVLYRLSVLVITGDFSSVFVYLGEFIRPAPWFVNAMLILYLIYFLFAKYIYPRFNKLGIYMFIGILTTVFAVLYITKLPIGTYSLEAWTCNSFSLEVHYFIMLPVWLICMLAGMLLRSVHRPSEEKFTSLCYLLAAAGCVFLFMCIKLLLGRGLLTWLEFLLPASYFGFAYCMFACFMNHEDMLARWAKTIPGKLVILISMCSLEIYYVQFRWINYLKGIAFPANFFALLVAIIVSAYLLHVVSGLLINPRRKK